MLFLLSFFLPCHSSSAGKESTCNAGKPNSIPGLGRSSGEGIGYPFQYSWAFLVAQMVKKKKKIHLQRWRPGFHPCVGKIPWRRNRLPTSVFLGFPRGSGDKESAWNAGDLSLIPGLGWSPGGGHGNPLQYLAWRIAMDREA